MYYIVDRASDDDVVVAGPFDTEDDVMDALHDNDPGWDMAIVVETRPDGLATFTDGDYWEDGRRG